MTPSTGMFLVCFITAIGGIGLVVVGLTRSDAGFSIVALGFLTIAAACGGALYAGRDGK
jgi:hypothetical protein